MRIASSWDDPDTFVDIKTDRIKYPDPKINIVVECGFEKRVPLSMKETIYTPYRGSQRANHLGRLYTCSMILMAYFPPSPHPPLSLSSSSSLSFRIGFVHCTFHQLQSLFNCSTNHNTDQHMVWHWFGSEMHRPLHRPALKDMMC